MTHKEIVQCNIDYLSDILSGAYIGGLIGIAVIIVQIQSISLSDGIKLLVFICCLGYIGYYCSKRRKEYINELEGMS
ncbi:MAG: hypothetical protein WCE94_07750 [Candidatus Methanoperedens sp.]